MDERTSLDDLPSKLMRISEGALEFPDDEAVVRDAADAIVRLVSAAKLARHEMRHTVAPRNSFTDALDRLDAALYPR